jgi:hypothetical protein
LHVPEPGTAKHQARIACNSELDATLHGSALTRLLLSLQLLIPAGSTTMNPDQPAIVRWWNCIKKCTEDDTSSY